MDQGQQRDSGGDPQALIECAACGEIYPGRKAEDGLYPIGTDGTCVCGADDFEEV